jgi:uncharacterized protein (TIGR02246 family)
MAAAQDADPQAQVEEVLQRYEEAVAAKDWDALGSLFTENAIFMPGTGGVAEGREAVQSAHVQMGLPTIDVRSNRTEAVGEGLILDFGTWSITLPEEAGGGTEEGEYVALYEQSENGLLARSLTAFSTRQPPGEAAQE